MCLNEPKKRQRITGPKTLVSGPKTYTGSELPQGPKRMAGLNSRKDPPMFSVEIDVSPGWLSASPGLPGPLAPVIV